MASVMYRNKTSKKTATYPQPNPRLERSEGWERVEQPVKKSADDKPKAKPKPKA